MIRTYWTKLEELLEPLSRLGVLLVAAFLLRETPLQTFLNEAPWFLRFPLDVVFLLVGCLAVAALVRAVGAKIESAKSEREAERG